VKHKHVYIYTDGSCDTTTGDGGWAYLLVYGRSRKESSSFETSTTNNRMELTAAVKALEALKEPCDVTLTTDSQYLRKAFTEGWLEKWQRNGWKTANKDSVKNQDLWEELLELSKTHTLKWEWTEGHVGHPENERVDKLALRARKGGAKSKAQRAEG
jgi:ribonuclease HI